MLPNLLTPILSYLVTSNSLTFALNVPRDNVSARTELRLFLVVFPGGFLFQHWLTILGPKWILPILQERNKVPSSNWRLII